MVMMNDGHLSRILKISQEKGATPERWTTVLASPVFAALLDVRADLSDPDAVLVALKLSPKRRRAPKKVLASLLEFYGEPVKVPTYDRFVAQDKFVIDTHGELPISYLDKNFERNFLDFVENRVKAVTLKQRNLLRRSADGPILSALGGVGKAKIALAHVFDFLITADVSRHFIFYVADGSGTPWALYASWNVRGWHIEANPVTRSGVWVGGRLVVSR